jgi:hypothetical protein
MIRTSLSHYRITEKLDSILLPRCYHNTPYQGTPRTYALTPSSWFYWGLGLPVVSQFAAEVFRNQ